MKHFIILLLACTLFPWTIQAQIITITDMHHDDDTLDVKYTKEMLQGKMWELEIPEGMEGYAHIYFKGDSLHQDIMYEGKKLEYKCIYYLSDSFQMDFDEEGKNVNQAGKYLQIQYLDADCDGKGRLLDCSYWIRKLTDDTLELVEWKSQDITDRFHAKPIKEQ